MRENLSKIRIKASPHGKRCGLFHYANETMAVTVLVEPKVWSTPNVLRPARWSENPKSLTVVLCELEELTLLLPAEWGRFLVEDVQGSIDEAVKFTVDAKRALLKAETTRGANDETYDDADSDLTPEDAVLNELVHFSSAKRARTATEPTPWSEAAADDAAASTALIALMQLAEKCDPGSDPWVHQADTSDGEGGVIGEGGRETKQELGVLVQWLFVELMRARSRKVRRGYVEVTESSPTLRGRMTARGMVQHVASGLPEIECRHDEFTEATMLFRILVTALEVVASGNVAGQYGLGGWSIAQRLAREAMHLRRQLMGIPALPVSVAAELVTGIRLTRLQREWERPLAVARQILRAEPPRMSATQEGSHAVQWWLDTSKLWERIVEQGFEKCGWSFASQGKDEESNKPFRPWVGLGKDKKPDTVAWLTRGSDPTRRVLVDAKYKLGVAAGSVTPADQYQIFAYSLLARVKGKPPDFVALLYPLSNVANEGLSGDSKVPASGPVAPSPYARSAVSGDSELILYVAQLPFPTREDLQNWPSFIASFGEQLSTSLKLQPQETE